MEDKAKIFKKLKPLLEKLKPPLFSKHDDVRYFDLWSQKDIVIDGRKKNEVSFAAIIIQKNYVGFYFMPIYIEAEMKNIFAPELLKLLKGKSCFYIKKLDEALLSQIDDALKAGFELYRKRGWLSE